MKLQTKYIFLTATIFAITAICFCLSIFLKLKGNEFFLIHDQWLFLSLEQLFKQASVRVFDSGGQPFSVQFSSGILHYFFSYPFLKLGLSIKNMEVFQFAIIIFISLFFPFLGFKKLYFYKNKNQQLSITDYFNILLITLFYFLSPYVVLAINGGVFWVINLALSFSFLPLFFYYTDRFTDNNSVTIIDSIIYALIVYFSSSLLTLFLPVIICTFFYVVGKWLINKKVTINLSKFFLSVLIFILLMLPFISMYVFETFFNKTYSAQGNVLTAGGGNQQGGLLYMFFFYFTWPLYIRWTPRNILTFSDYYVNNLFPLVPLSLFITLLIYLIKLKNIRSRVLPFLLILLVSLFIGKGPQKPLGEIFNYIVNNFVLFSAIRSPDNKFAPLIIFSIAAIFLYILRTTTHRIFLYFYLTLVIILMSFPLLTGEAILGKNKPGVSSEFKTSINNYFKDALKIINSDRQMANIIIYPPIRSVTFYQPDGSLYGGQDMFTMSINKPILYFDTIQPITSKLSSKLSQIYNKFNFQKINELNVKFIIIRKSLYFYYNTNPYDFTRFRSQLLHQVPVKKILDNDYMDIYEVDNKQFEPRIRVLNPNVKVNFIYINPIKYKISIKNINTEEKLIFAESFNKYWRLYDDRNNNTYFSLKDIGYLFKKPLFGDSHTIINDYQNSWTIDPTVINSSEINLVLYYLPQSLFYITVISSLSVFLILISILFFKAIDKYL